MTDTTTSTWTTLGNDIALIGTAIAAVFPAEATAIGVATKIVQGMLEGVPAALELYDNITSGKTVTAADLASYVSDYETAYQKLNADADAALAKLA